MHLYSILSEPSDPEQGQDSQLVAQLQAAASEGQPMHECPRTCISLQQTLHLHSVHLHTTTAHRHFTSPCPQASNQDGDAFTKCRTHALCFPAPGKKQVWETNPSLLRKELLCGCSPEPPLLPMRAALPAESNPASLLYLRKGQEEFQGFFF